MYFKTENLLLFLPYCLYQVHGNELLMIHQVQRTRIYLVLQHEKLSTKNNTHKNIIISNCYYDSLSLVIQTEDEYLIDTLWLSLQLAIKNYFIGIIMYCDMKRYFFHQILK